MRGALPNQCHVIKVFWCFGAGRSPPGVAHTRQRDMAVFVVLYWEDTPGIPIGINYFVVRRPFRGMAH